MSGFQEDQFPSQFNNSYFNTGPFSDHNLETVKDTTFNPTPVKQKGHLPKKIGGKLSLKPFGHEAPKVCFAPPSYVKAQITIKSTSDANVSTGGSYEYLTHENVKFSYEDFEELDCVAMGSDILIAIADFSDDRVGDIDNLISAYLRWVFRGDQVAQDATHANFLAKAVSYYLDNRPGSPPSALEKALMMIQAMAKKALKEKIAAFFTWLANTLREAKIGEGQEPLWKPHFDGEKYVYTPIFIPDIKIDTEILLQKIHLTQETTEKNTSEKEWTQEMDGTEAFYAGLFSTEYLKEIQVLIDGIKYILAPYNQFAEYTRHLNAFLVGLYNGIIEMIAGTLELISYIFDGEKLGELLASISSLIEAIKEKGIQEVLGDIFDAFIQKYEQAESSYDIAKFIGEDIAEILLSIIVTAFTGGTGAVVILSNGTKIVSKSIKDLSKLIERLGGHLKDPDKLVKYFREKPKSKNRNINLDPPVFRHLNEEQKAAYLIQRTETKQIKESNTIPKGKKQKADGTYEKRKKSDHTTKGNWGEMEMDQFFLNLHPPGKRFKPLHQMVSNLNADNPPYFLDGIYENLDYPPSPPPKYLFVEAKTTEKGAMNMTLDGRQMSEDWIFNRRLENTLRKNPEFADLPSEQMKALIEEIHDSYASILYHKKEINGAEVLRQLDKDGKRIGKPLDDSLEEIIEIQ